MSGIAIRNLGFLLVLLVIAAARQPARSQEREVALEVQAAPLVAELWGIATDIIGDADRSGAFDAGDVAWVREALRHGKSPRTLLADVSRPCNGRLESTDGQRLLGAVMEMRRGVTVRSHCHGQPIGSPWDNPADRKLPPLVSLDDQFVSVARLAPEFGGLYLEDDRLKVVLTDDSKAALDRALLGIGKIFGDTRFNFTAVEAVRGDFAFPELNRWKELANTLLTLRPVSFVDADERLNRVRIGIIDESYRDSVEARLERLDVPIEAIVVEIRPKARLNEHILVPMLQSKRRPLTAGSQITRMAGSQTLGRCTIGFLGKWYGSGRGIVTTGHCEQTAGVVAGTPFFQPSPPDQVAIEAVDYPFGCSWGDRCRQSDAMFLSLDEGITGRMGVVPRSTHVYPHGGSYRLTGKGTAVCGEHVTAVGTVSGERSGEVEYTCTSFSFEGAQAGWGDEDFVFTCQTQYDPPGQQGDSGGPVFRRLGWGDDAVLVGLHVGVYETPSYDDSIYSPIGNIEAELGPFEVAYGNEPPEIEIISPTDGSKIGGGAFPTVGLQAKFFDFEIGTNCADCEVRWYSGKDGNLGVTPVVDGLSGHSTVLGGGQGYRAITATAVDGGGAETWDTVVVSTANNAPQVWIDWPEPAASLHKGFTYTFQGSSFDPEDFHALPCDDLEWTSYKAQDTSFPTSGCYPQVSFDTLGIHLITLTGHDELMQEAKTTIAILVTEPPASGPPSVNFIQPPSSHYVSPTGSTTITALATDPENQPVSYQWLLSGNGVAGQVSLGTTTGASGVQSSTSLTPSTHVLPGCGAESITVTVIAIDADGQSDIAQLPLYVAYNPC